jgi:hypothetical protein
MNRQNVLFWKSILNYENYEISNTGLVKNIKFGKMKNLIEIPMKHFIKREQQYIKMEKGNSIILAND